MTDSNTKTNDTIGGTDLEAQKRTTNSTVTINHLYVKEIKHQKLLMPSPKTEGTWGTNFL